ncbi:MAG: response regulator [Haloarculaceae archaeon]
MAEPIHVLVVDDSDFFAEMTADTLASEHGMDARWAGGPDEALAVIGEAPVDCVVSDYEMPGIDGLELLSRIRERHGDLPFVLLTGRGTEAVAARAISAGVSDYVLKLEVVEDQQYQQLAKRVRSAVEQRRARRRYERLVENTPDAVAQVSTDGEVLAANPAFAELADAPADEVVGSAIDDRLPDGIGAEWLAAGREAVRRNESRSVETAVDDRYFSNVFVPVEVQTGRETFQLIARDVTERIERERELTRQNERLESFASMVSHDLRNPLDVAQVNTALLAEHFADPPEELRSIERAHDRMVGLIEDLLSLARQGATVEDPEPTAVADAAEAVWPFVESGDVGLVADATVEVVADPDRLQELLSNLFRNAIEHGSPGAEPPATDAPADDGGLTAIRVGDLPGGDGFYVADDGPGVPPDRRERVFDAGYSTSEEGTGFGLAIVAEIADAHGWAVAATGSEAGGARFEVSGVRTP